MGGANFYHLRCLSDCCYATEYYNLNIIYSSSFELFSANVVETAQATSTLYDSKNDVAAPLKPDKIIKPETVGKGWFDFQVKKLLNRIFLIYVY